MSAEGKETKKKEEPTREKIPASWGGGTPGPTETNVSYQSYKTTILTRL
jgi:hypothetical protein